MFIEMRATQPPSARRAMFIEALRPSRPPPGGQCRRGRRRLREHCPPGGGRRHLQRRPINIALLRSAVWQRELPTLSAGNIGVSKSCRACRGDLLNAALFYIPLTDFQRKASVIIISLPLWSICT